MPIRGPLLQLADLIVEPKDSATIHYDEDTLPHGACSDPIRCDCCCPHCWQQKAGIIVRGLKAIGGPAFGVVRAVESRHGR